MAYLQVCRKASRAFLFPLPVRLERTGKRNTTWNQAHGREELSSIRNDATTESLSDYALRHVEGRVFRIR
ncbi:hypothetical protein BH10ACI4_BH10ACI4_01180 [soil metagenome]